MAISFWQLARIEIHQPKPVAYQDYDSAGQKQLVDVAYWIDASNHIRFRTGAYDRRSATGDRSADRLRSIFRRQRLRTTPPGFTRDAEGGLYIVGTTNSTDFPIVNPVQSQLGTAPLLVTANAGKSWSFPSLKSANSVSAIVAAPSSPSVLYVATLGWCFLRAPTAGQRGPQQPAPASRRCANCPRGGCRVRPPPLYAGTAQGIFVSSDGAAQLESAPNQRYSASTGIVAIVAHPTQWPERYLRVSSNPTHSFPQYRFWPDLDPDHRLVSSPTC